MDSSKTTTIGIILIFVVFIGWLVMMNNEQPKVPNQPTAASTAETTKAVQPQASAQAPAPAAPEAAPPSPLATDTANESNVFARTSSAPAVTKDIETPLVSAEISSKGAAITSYILKKYQTWEHTPVQLVNQTGGRGADIALKFVASDGKIVSTNDLPFTLDPKTLTIGANDTVRFAAFYRMDSDRYIEKDFQFGGSQYAVEISYKLQGLENMVSGYHYTAALESPIPYVEQRAEDETSNARAFAGQAGEIETLDVKKSGARDQKTVDGTIAFAGMRNQYFEEAMIPVDTRTTGAQISGFGAPAPSVPGGVVSQYYASITIPIGRTANESMNFKLYFGPLELSRVSALGVGLEQSMDFGWPIIRQIGMYILMPLFLWLHGFIANWGIVILIFSLIIKLVTIPLSTGQMRSMKKMQVVQPMVTELRDKYKDDPKKQQEEMMKVYRTYGVNPVGGCLPLVLQMPILFALYTLLRNAIQLRQSPFAFWIHDLSVPDALIHFGTSLPLIGAQMSGLTLLLVVTMIIQQQFTVTDPRQKQMMYIMPAMYLFMFNNLPSGVGLYYVMFNIFGIIQQIYITKFVKAPSLEELKKAPKKGGGLMARMQDMEKQQRELRQQQYLGKGAPGAKKRK